MSRLLSLTTAVRRFSYRWANFAFQHVYMGLFHHDADERVMAAILRRAWADNEPNPIRFRSAQGFARAAFCDKVGAYVRRYYRWHQRYPVGPHLIWNRTYYWSCQFACLDGKSLTRYPADQGP
jgi:hypothetical protein